MNIFWETIALYNSATWIYQIIIMVFGLILTLMLLYYPRRWVKIGMKIYLIAIYLWISIIYYHIYCAPRSYNNVMSVFWGILAAAWIWDLITGYTRFERNSKYNKLSCLLLVMPFLYPLFSCLRGLSFPEITSPVMPCSVVVFTIGLLLLFSRRVNLFIILLLCHWSMIGLSKTYFFKIPEDFLLACAAVPALYLFFKEYYLCDLKEDTKPKSKYINWLLIALCMGIVAVLLGSMAVELVQDI